MLSNGSFKWQVCWPESDRFNLTLTMLDKYVQHTSPGFIQFIHVTCMTQVISIYLQAVWKTVWFLIRWLHQKPADLDLHCFLKRIYLGSVGQGLIKCCQMDICDGCSTENWKRNWRKVDTDDLTRSQTFQVPPKVLRNIFMFWLYRSC